MHQFGSVGLKSLRGAFKDCKNLITAASSVIDTDISGSSYGLIPSTNDISTVTDMSQTFQGTSSLTAFNYPNGPNLNDIDVSNVESMDYLFQGAKVLEKVDTSSWKTGKVKGMRSLFEDTTLLNPDVSTWDVSRVTDMGKMFYGAKGAKLGSVNMITGEKISYLKNWNTSGVTSMEYIFSEMGDSGNGDNDLD